MSAQRRVYPVSVVNRYVKQLLVQDVILQNLWVSGEISNFKHHSSGHLYFTIKDENGALSAVMFAREAKALRFEPENGQQVQVQGAISLYEKTGQYQLYVRQMEPAGSGALYLAFEALKEKLQAQGLFDESKKKKIPRFPRRIGIVTSPTGAAVRDMIQIARRRNPGVSLVVYPAKVQGEGAADTIVNGIRRLDLMPEIDTIIVGRGGGSLEDLWAFNEEKVALAIAQAHTPVISAVGHETDFTIADFVADLRAPTPSAAAELAVPDTASVWTSVVEMTLRRQKAWKRYMQHERQKQMLLSAKLAAMAPRRTLDDHRQMLDMLLQRRRYAMHNRLQQNRFQLQKLSDVLQLLSPLHPLEKGYALVMDEAGAGISSIRQVKEGQTLQIQMKDGVIDAKASRIHEKE